LDFKVEVRGIGKFNSGLRRIDRTLPGEMKKEFLELSDYVAGRIRSKVPRRTGRAAASVKPKATTRSAGIAFGGNAAPYYPWLDFGGRVGRNKSIVRPFIKEGRYVYPTLRQERDNIAEAADTAIERVAERAGFKTRGGV
jgi:hypothetical protein